ncbi:MAG: hypothetical protein M1476_00530 [Candidatus Thermoplasmatota archaeon]|nr:hypothetical protein [Candidatus Thermoplasmatota archaeon]
MKNRSSISFPETTSIRPLCPLYIMSMVAIPYSVPSYGIMSSGSRSDREARDLARVYGILETRRKRGKPPFRADGITSDG